MPAISAKQNVTMIVKMNKESVQQKPKKGEPIA